MTFPRTYIVVLCIVVIAAATFAVTLLHSTVYAPIDKTDESVLPAGASTSTAIVSAVQAGTPERIRIPSIGVDASIEDVGLGHTGNMAVPLQYADAGWYRYGTVPGEVGSAVIDGHVDNGLAIPAVFARLSELQAGDDIYIDTQDGQTVHFVVESSDTYAVAEVPRETLFNRSDKARLNLITCDGTWIADQKMYDERHVVYAVLAA